MDSLHILYPEILQDKSSCLRAAKSPTPAGAGDSVKIDSQSYLSQP